MGVALKFCARTLHVDYHTSWFPHIKNASVAYAALPILLMPSVQLTVDLLNFYAAIELWHQI